MELSQVLKSLPITEMQGNLSGEVTRICYNSRDCSAGALFVAVPGSVHDGHDFIDDAVRRGARYVIHENNVSLRKDVALIRVPDSRIALSRAASNFHGNPSKRLCVIGVTGTNGKTTVTYILEAILKAAGLNAGVIGTINCRYAGTIISLANTTPESLDLQRTFKNMADEGISHVIMEVSSHAIDLKRVQDVDFDRGLFTNLSGEHLDYHGSMENYYAVKKRFFADLLKGRPAIINGDDSWGRRLKDELDGPLITFGINGPWDVSPLSYSLSTGKMEVMVKTPGATLSLSSSLTGVFNLSNVLAAVALAGSLGVPEQSVVAGIAQAGPVPGRLERIPSEQDFSVFVDYAHTEDALRNVLETLRRFDHRRLITVFGCGGERDRTKRPLMGRTATELSDCTVITSDNPRGENPAAIICEIESGINGTEVRKADSHDVMVPDNKEYRVMEDRREAIDWAISSALPGDIVLIAGKGHEDYQIVGSRHLPFDDRQIAARALEARRSRSGK